MWSLLLVTSLASPPFAILQVGFDRHGLQTEGGVARYIGWGWIILNWEEIVLGAPEDVNRKNNAATQEVVQITPEARQLIMRWV